MTEMRIPWGTPAGCEHERMVPGSDYRQANLEKLRFERERINRVSALLKQRGYAPIDGAVGAYAEGLVAVFRDLDEAHARAERAESEFRGVARRQA